MVVEGELPRDPCIWVSWHGNNLLALACYQSRRARAYAAFVPPGLAGAAMIGWHRTVGCADIVPLPRDGTGNVASAMKRMAKNLRRGLDVLVALDGPSGPRHRARPGALWLARLTRAPLVPFGAACRPGVGVPRWDRLLVPIPGARVAGVVGPVREYAADAAVDGASAERLGDELTRLDAMARAILVGRSLDVPDPIRGQG
jgi:lysophospholipid acyltransferase (LPLAT)-like uncharacterized protein